MNEKGSTKTLQGYGVAFAFLVLLALLVFRSALGVDNAFSASDANIGQLAGGQPELSELFSPSYGGFILGTVRPPRFSPYALIHAILPVTLFNDLIAPLYLISSSFLLMIFLRIRQRSWGASFFGAVSAFWLGSATLASAGHYGKLGAACFFTAALVLIEKSITARGLRRLCWAVLAGAAVGFMLLSQQDIGMLFGLLLGPYALFRLLETSPRKPLDWALTLIPIALIGLVLSAGTALSAYKTNIVQAASVSQSAEDKWNFITQWSQPPGELPDLLSPGFMGWKTGHPDAPYWGRTGQSAEWPDSQQGFRNFRLDSVYLGLIPFIFSLVALLSTFDRKNKGNGQGTIIFWWIMALVLLVLAFGKYTPAYRLMIELPLYGSIRAPIKLLHNLGIVLGILSAYGIDAVLTSRQARKHAWVTAVIVGGCFLLWGIKLMLGASAFESKLSGWGVSAPLLVKRMMFSSFYSAIFAGLFALLVNKGVGRSTRVFICLACLFPTFDSLYITKHYFYADDLPELKRGNAVIDYLKEHQEHQSVFSFDRSGVYNRWIGVVFPLHGIKGFWFWQAPRLSQEYKDYLAVGGKNVVALMQATSVKYALAPAGAINQLPKDVLNPVMFYRFGTDAKRKLIVQQISSPSSTQDQALFELRKTLPRLSLFHDWKKIAPEQMYAELFSKPHDIMGTVLVNADLPEPNGTGYVEPKSVEWKTSSIRVETGAQQDAVLMFTQRFQPQWKAYIDGKEAPVFRCNALAMGVYVPVGSSEVTFKCTGYELGSILQVIGLSITLAAISGLLLGRKVA